MRWIVVAVPYFVLSAAWGQPSGTTLTFEVAAVKAAAPQQPGHTSWSSRSDPGMYSATNLSLKVLILQAFHVQPWQLQCPDWMESERYDIQAKVPEGAPKGRVSDMLQNLLVERFRMALHREQHELPSYTLVVAKNGHKMKEVAPEPPDDPNDEALKQPPRMPLPPTGPPPKDKDGYPIVSRSNGFSSSSSGGTVKVTARAETMAHLTVMLRNQIQSEVIDKTGLNGKYDFRFEFAGPSRLSEPIFAAGMPRSSTAPPPDPLSGDFGTTIFKALQDQLGLRLDAGKSPVEVLVIDKAEKMPIEN